jgi:FKBP-type peptidyl-prolyl cis-trans isomerase
MSENAPRPGDPRPAIDPAAVRPGGVMGTGESIVVKKAEPGRRATPAAEEEPEVFASTVRRKPLSEAGYDADPPRVGRLGVILGTVLAVLLVGSGITVYLRSDSNDSKPVADSAPTASESAPSPSPSPSPSVTVPPIKDTAAVLPTISGSFGKKATIEVPKKQPDGTFVVKTLTEGTGPVVSKGDWVVADYSAKDWTTGKSIPSSYDKGARAQLFQADAGELIPALDRSVAGRKVGSRVAVVAPPAAAFGSAGSSALGIGAKDTLVFVVDIVRATGPTATVSGTPTAPPADMPQVKDNGKKAATITPSKGVAAPTKLKSAVLIKGSGPKVTTGEKVVVQYTGVLYSNGKKFDSSLDRGEAFSFATGGGQVIKGWDQGVVGHTVGSRIELVVPPSLGYADQEQKGIPKNSTLVFVIDILDAG